jgi:hypothetical protein
MSPAALRREANRILRDSARSMSRTIAEAERLLKLADSEAEHEIDVRRAENYERELNPEFFT